MSKDHAGMHYTNMRIFFGFDHGHVKNHGNRNDYPDNKAIHDEYYIRHAVASRAIVLRQR